MQNPIYSVTENILVSLPGSEVCRSDEFHFHKHWEIYILVEGTVLSICDGKSVTVSAPCIIVHKPYSLHRLFYGGITDADEQVSPAPKGYCVDFSEGYIGRYLLPDILPHTLFDSEDVVFSASKERYRNLCLYCDILMRSCDAKCDDDANIAERNKLLTAAMLREFSLVFAEKSPAKCDDTHRTSVRLGYLYDILETISADPGLKNPVDKLAKQYYISPAKLRCDFKLITSDTLGDYIDCIKLIHAMLLLEEGKSVNETAVLCGYANHNSFIRFFKEKTGNTPAKYAKYE